MITEGKLAKVTKQDEELSKAAALLQAEGHWGGGGLGNYVVEFDGAALEESAGVTCQPKTFYAAMELAREAFHRNRPSGLAPGEGWPGCEIKIHWLKNRHTFGIVWPKKVPKADTRAYGPYSAHVKTCAVCRQQKKRKLFPARALKCHNKKKPSLRTVCLDCIRLAIGA